MNRRDFIAGGSAVIAGVAFAAPVLAGVVAPEKPIYGTKRIRIRYKKTGLYDGMMVWREDRPNTHYFCGKADAVRLGNKYVSHYVSMVFEPIEEVSGTSSVTPEQWEAFRKKAFRAYTFDDISKIKKRLEDLNDSYSKKLA